MQSRTLNYPVLVISFLIFNGAVLAAVRPFNLLASIVMMVCEIAVVSLALRIFRK